MLLLKLGGPIESLLPKTTIQALKVGDELVAVAVETLRVPVYIRTKEQHANVFTDLEETAMEFTVGEGDLEWLRGLQVRMSDEELEKVEGDAGRRLMVKRDLGARREDGGWLGRMGLR